MAEAKIRWVKNFNGAPGPLIKWESCQAGATQAIETHEVCELSSGNMIPLASDKAMAGTVAIYAGKDIESGDRAGFYPFIVPRVGDVFEASLDSATNPDYGTDLYYEATGNTLTTTTGTNVIGKVWDHDGFPHEQGHLTDGDLRDNGTTIGNVLKVHMTFLEGVSLLNTHTGDDAT